MAWLLAIGCVVLLVFVGQWMWLANMKKKALRVAAHTEEVIAGTPVNEDMVRSTGVFADSIVKLMREIRRRKGLSLAILKGLPMPFLLVDKEERVMMTNQATMDMLQIDSAPETQQGRTLAEVFYNDASRKTAVGKSIHHGEIFNNLEVTIAGHKGGTRHVLANVYPLYDLDRKCTGGICLYLDMTKLKEKEQELCNQNEIISHAASKATEVADSLAAASDELSAQVDSTRGTADAQSESTSEVASAIEQMSSSIMEVADNARSLTDLAEDSHAKASLGVSEVERTRQVILVVRREAEELMHDMEQLGEHADRIGNVLNVISDIADQTNLLALNAAIEAARAGEAGRGFAVVADEVRKLAEKTMLATEEVHHVVRSIQESARKSRQSTESAVASVMQGVESAAATGEKIQEVLAGIEQTTNRVRDIAAAVQQQSQASDQVAAATSHIQKAANETVVAMRESSFAVNELARMAGELKGIIGELKEKSLRECS